MYKLRKMFLSSCLSTVSFRLFTRTQNCTIHTNIYKTFDLRKNLRNSVQQNSFNRVKRVITIIIRKKNVKSLTRRKNIINRVSLILNLDVCQINIVQKIWIDDSQKKTLAVFTQCDHNIEIPTVKDIHCSSISSH